MSRMISRRALGLMAGAATLSATWPRSVGAQARTVTALGHRVHQTAATSGPSGDATETWRKTSGASVNWVTFGDVNAIHERLLREATLGETTIDMAYLLNGRAVPRNLALFEPLDALMKEAPIEDVADVAPGLIAPLRLNGALHGIPVRHATNALIYNEALLEERGISTLPTTFEDLAEIARKLNFKRDDGTQVFGLAFTAAFASNFLTLARCFDGDYMTSDGKLVANEPGMVKALMLLADVYKAGVLPRNFATVNNEEITTWMQQGRAAITINPFARLVTYNDPSKGRYAGRFKSLLPPMAADLVGKVAFAPTVEFWSLVIPKNSRQKPLGWEMIRALSSKAGTTAMALNGNGPVRISTYADEKLKAAMPYAADEAAALAASRIHLPAFDEQARAHDIFIEETQAAVLGIKPAQQAMDDAVKRVKPLLG